MPQNRDTLAEDAARYAKRLAEIADHLVDDPEQDTKRAVAFLRSASRDATEASTLIPSRPAGPLRLHINQSNQNEILLEAVRSILETQPGETPVTMHRGADTRNLPFAVRLTPALVLRLQAILGEAAVWTEAR